MTNNIPKLLIREGIPTFEGQFGFSVSKNAAVDMTDFIPKKQITFFFSVEQQQDISAYISMEEVYEMYGEKLKQDFIKFASTYKNE